MKQQSRANRSFLDRRSKKPGWSGLLGLMVLFFMLASAVFATRAPATAASPTPAEIDQTNTQPLSADLPSAAPSTQRDAQATLACDTNPFGDVHDLYLENEVFVSATSTFGFNPNVTAFMLDQGKPQGTITTLMEEWLYYEDSNPNGFALQTHAVTAADLDGDGKSELVQTFLNSNDEWYLTHYDDPTATTIAPNYYRVSLREYNPVVAASGHISNSNSFQEQVVLAGVDHQSGKVNVLLWDGSNSNGVMQHKGRWSSTAGGRWNSTLLDIVTGDFIGDTREEIAVLMKQSDGDMELVVLEYDSNHNVSYDMDNVEIFLKPVANVEFSPANPSEIRVVAGRLNADFRDEILVAYNDLNADDQIIHLFAFELDPLNRTLNHLSQFNKSIAYEAGSFDMAAGMGEIDGDFLREEIAIMYPADDGLHVQVFGAQNLTSTTPSLANLYDWSIPWTLDDERSQAQYLSLAVGDLNNEGPDEIVAAFDDGRGLEVIYLDQANLVANTLTATLDLDPVDLSTRTAIALGDANLDSIRAQYSGDCREVKEDNMNSVVYPPPIWPNIQQQGFTSFTGGFIGESRQGATTAERSLGYERSTVTSGYVGIGIEAEYGVASFEASAKFTMEEEYSQGSAQGTAQTSSIADSVEFRASENFAVGDESTYYCYNYDVLQNGTPITDTTSLRSCELVSSIKNSPTLAGRESRAVFLETSINKALEWVPATRDWASLALFHEISATQSSTSSNGTAGKAVDGMLKGEPISMTSTTVEDYPWWEIDLGQPEDITKIRIWNREDLAACPVPTCTAHLSDLYIFVSETPFSNTDTPTDLLGDSNVNSYSLATISDPLSSTVGTDFPAGRVTTFLTLQANITGTILPIQGQYVRVQINRTNAQLQLAEVQVFGPEQVDPNRYPLDIDNDGPGYFKVQLYDPNTSQNRWIEVRGDLLWSGRKNGGTEFVTVAVPADPVEVGWSRETQQTDTEFSSATISEKKSVGFEFDMEAGAIVKAQAGFGMEWSTGVFQETTHSTSWTDGFEIGGWVKGFPNLAQGDTLWYNQCQYSIRPFYYVVTEESSFGYQSSHTVLDYLITIDRTQDMTPCQLGHPYNPTSNASNDEAAGTAGGGIVVYALLNDAGTENLRIVSVDDPPNGSATFTDRTILYFPDGGFIGQDSFNYTISDGVTSSTATATVTVNPILVYLPMVVR